MTPASYVLFIIPILVNYFFASHFITIKFPEVDKPMTGERNKTIKYVTRILDNDSHVFEVYDLVGTKGDFKALEIVYTRRK